MEERNTNRPTDFAVSIVQDSSSDSKKKDRWNQKELDASINGATFSILEDWSHSLDALRVFYHLPFYNTKLPTKLASACIKKLTGIVLGADESVNRLERKSSAALPPSINDTGQVFKGVGLLCRNCCT